MKIKILKNKYPFLFSILFCLLFLTTMIIQHHSIASTLRSSEMLFYRFEVKTNLFFMNPQIETALGHKASEIMLSEIDNKQLLNFMKMIGKEEPFGFIRKGLNNKVLGHHESAYSYYSQNLLPFFNEIHMGVNSFYSDVSRQFHALLILFVLSLIAFSAFANYACNCKHRDSSTWLLKREYEDHLLKTQELELNQIAYDLHDDIAQNLVFLQSEILSTFPSVDEKAQVKNVLRDIIQKVRRMSQNLRSPDFLNQSLTEALQALCQDFKIQLHGTLQYSIMGLRNASVEKTKSLHIYRIVQELLSNARKHAKAKHIDMKIVYSYPFLIVRYRDNGIGFEIKDVENGSHQGIGLSGLRHRANVLDADLQIDTSLNKGTQITFKIPLKTEAVQ